MKSGEIKYYDFLRNDSRKPTLVFVSRDDKGFCALRFYDAEAIYDWPPGISFRFVKMRDSDLEDMIGGGLHWILVAERFRQILMQNSIKGVQFLPVTVIEDKTNREIGPYWAMNVIQEADALDYDKTLWVNPITRELDKHPSLNILRPTLRCDNLIGIDIFRLRVGKENETSIFISQKIKSLLEKSAAIVGIKFIPMPMS